MNVFGTFSSEAKAEGLSGARNCVAKKTKWTKKDSTTTPRRTTNFVPVKLFTFLSKFLSFSPSFNLQKLFLMFSTTTIYPKDVLRNFFSNKIFFPKKIIYLSFFLNCFSIFFFLNFFSVCLNSTTSFCILLIKQTKTL